MVTSMNTDRSGFVVGVLNDHLYAANIVFVFLRTLIWRFYNFF